MRMPVAVNSPSTGASPFVKALVQIAWSCKPNEVGFEQRLQTALHQRFDLESYEGEKFTDVEKTELRLRQQFIERTLADLLVALKPLKDDRKPIAPVSNKSATLRTNENNIVRKPK